MATCYTPAPREVIDLCNSILCAKERHKPLLDCKVKIDLVFAHAERDDKTGERIGCALKHHGLPALGIARKIGLKDRAMGRGDAEICLDADWWEEHEDEDQRRALLDHELTHLQVKVDKRGIVRDDLHRPVIVLRPHSHEFGWFDCIAEEYGADSQERQQAFYISEQSGQYYWPSMYGVSNSVSITGDAAARARSGAKANQQRQDEPPTAG